MRDMWNQRYAEPGFAYGTRENEFLASVVHLIPKGPVLCLGEGEGRNAVYLAEKGYDVTAIDTSTVGLEMARNLACRRDVEIITICEYVASFNIQPSTWAGIISIYFHVPPALRADLHTRCVRGLVPGGVFILEGYTPKQLDYKTGGPQNPEFLMSETGLRQELSSLRFQIAREIERDVIEGKYHTGRSSVVQILAVK